MEIIITVFTPEPSDAKDFRYILNDVKRQKQILKELTDYVCSFDEVVIYFGAFNSEKIFMFGYNIHITNTNDRALVNKLLKTADMYVITGATTKSLEEIIKENNKEE